MKLNIGSKLYVFFYILKPWWICFVSFAWIVEVNCFSVIFHEAQIIRWVFRTYEVRSPELQCRVEWNGVEIHSYFHSKLIVKDSYRSLKCYIARYPKLSANDASDCVPKSHNFILEVPGGGQTTQEKVFQIEGRSKFWLSPKIDQNR